MLDARRLPLLALVAASAVLAVVAVATLSPSTATEGGDPLASTDRAASTLPDGEPGDATGGRPSTTPSHDGGGAPTPGRPPRSSTRPSVPEGGPSDAAQRYAEGQVAPGGRTGSGARSSRGGTSGAAGGAAGPTEGAGADGDNGDDDAGTPDGFRDEASAARADWLEERMQSFVDTLIPEAAGTGLSRSCADNGLTCTFEGPATDDFAARWVQALSYGDMNDETLQGTTLKDFRFYETDDGMRFSIEARHPDR